MWIDARRQQIPHLNIRPANLPRKVIKREDRRENPQPPVARPPSGRPLEAEHGTAGPPARQQNQEHRATSHPNPTTIPRVLHADSLVARSADPNALSCLADCTLSGIPGLGRPAVSSLNETSKDSLICQSPPTA